jgi:hypothetical protein
MPSVKDSDFDPGRVGKLQAITQKVKHTKTKGTVVKGKYQYLLFSPLIHGNSFFI